MVVDTSDADWMGVALVLAERGRGQTSPNPMVGAVVVAPDGVAVGLGYHQRAGEPHAEIHALRSAGERARGATLYCTLEPCSHVGRTGPCCVAVAAAGIARVVAAAPDPNPAVAGRGLEYLKTRGIEVACGVRAHEASRQNVAFFTAMRKGRPWVVLKVAVSLDAAVARAPGQRTAITSREANREIHRFRAEVDAIGIGSGTLLADDPQLTARGVFRDRPLTRVIFDSRLRTPPGAAVFATRDAGPIVLVTTEAACSASHERVEALRASGAELYVAPLHDLAAALTALGRRDLRSIVLEGGPTLHRAAWRAGIVDKVQMFVAPAVLGPAALAWAMPADFAPMSFVGWRATPVGSDVLLEGECSPD